MPGFGLSPENRETLAGLDDAPSVFALDAAAMDELALLGQDVADAELDARTEDVTVKDLATINYPSSTTGRAEGAMLTHGNLVEHSKNVELDPDFGGFVQGETRVLLFLPLAHVFARFVMPVSY